MCAFPRRFSLGPVILASSDAEASTPMLVSLEIVFVCSVPRTGKGRVACRARACCSKYAVAQLALPLDAHGRAEPLGSLCAGRGVVMDARTRPLEQRLSVDITLCHKKMSSHARCPCGLGLKPPRTVRKWVEVGGRKGPPPQHSHHRHREGRDDSACDRGDSRDARSSFAESSLNNNGRSRRQDTGPTDRAPVLEDAALLLELAVECQWQGQSPPPGSQPHSRRQERVQSLISTLTRHTSPVLIVTRDA